jgi:hypothetical protein
VRPLSRTRTLNTLFPIGQYIFHISLSTLQSLNVLFDTFELFLGKLVHAAARSASIVPSSQDFGQLSQRESDPKRSLHNQHSLYCARGIESVTRLCSRRPWEDPDPFIVSNCVWTHPRRLRQGAGPKSFGTAALHHEEYEPWNAFQNQGIFADQLEAENREFDSDEVGSILGPRGPYSGVGEEKGSIATGCGLRKKWR